MSPTDRRAKPRTSSTDARARLVEAVIQLADTTPLPDLTARRIAAEVGMDPNVIFRNFESLENLFVAVLRHLEETTVDVLASSDVMGLLPIREVFLWIKFSSWLSLTGTDPALLEADPDLLNALRDLTVRHLNINPQMSGRAKSAAVVIAFSYMQAQVLFTPTQPQLFTDEAMRDSSDLLVAFIDQLGGQADTLA